MFPEKTKPNSADAIKVSVLVLTYNHEKYLAQTLDSILAQKVSFPIELIIAEDCSTDATRDVIAEYRDKFENCTVLLNNKNRGGIFTIITASEHISGEYYCFLEGDDYWTDPTKLQQQVDILDQHKEYVGCSHNTELFYQAESRTELLHKEPLPDEYGADELITSQCYCHTSSYLWRRTSRDIYPLEMHYNKMIGDWFVSIYKSQFGKIKYIDRTMSTYRISGTGIYSKLSQLNRDYSNIRGAIIYNKLLKYKFDHIYSRNLPYSVRHILFQNLSPSKIRSPSDVLILLRLIFLHLSFVSFDKHLPDRSSIGVRRKYQIANLARYMYIQMFRKLINPVSKFIYEALHLFDMNRYKVLYKKKLMKLFGIEMYESDYQ
ncbi:glycosyltransferase [Thalassospira profundimaris]|uniref:Glycosyltransferase 2-like domain-containing protein n=1 Tax=Thalassospira profundimaris TaxID=502049 RepID=A0A367WK82_9PROT|nr:glycosyltransferase [Thalassospira profundimaris]RCK40971.1 hypothetical protein TH30_22390 [Thalassospira profundimaris]